MPRPLPDAIAAALSEDNAGYTESTLRIYRAAMRDFLTWTSAHPGIDHPGIEHSGIDYSGIDDSGGDDSGSDSSGSDGSSGDPLPPPRAVAGYLKDRIGLSFSTLTSRRQALRLVYGELAGEAPFERPDVQRVWEEILRMERGEPSEPEKDRPGESGPDSGPGIAATLERGLKVLRKRQGEPVLNPVPDSVKDDLQYLPTKKARPEALTPRQKQLIPEVTYDLGILRDRLVLLLLGTTELTRSEIAGIDVGDVYLPEKEGGQVKVLIYKSGAPSFVLLLERAPELRFCLPRALASWVLAAGLTEGPLFRSLTPHGNVSENRIRPQTVYHILRRRAEEAGFDREEWTIRSMRREP